MTRSVTGATRTVDPNERRLMMAFLPKETVLSWLWLATSRDPMDAPGTLNVHLPAIPQRLPDDAVVVSVHYEWQYDGFGVLIRSATYDVVPEGQIVPRIESGASLAMTYRVLSVKDPEAVVA